MDITSMVTVGVVISIGISAAVSLYYYKKHNVKKLFEQVYITSKQIPKQKKNSFLLLMFKESMSSSKKKSTAAFEQLNNPKHLEIKLMQMSKILKDRSKVQDKTIKRALTLLNEYLAWEKEKNTTVTQVSRKKHHK